MVSSTGLFEEFKKKYGEGKKSSDELISEIVEFLEQKKKNLAFFINIKSSRIQLIEFLDLVEKYYGIPIINWEKVWGCESDE